MREAGSTRASCCERDGDDARRDSPACPVYYILVGSTLTIPHGRSTVNSSSVAIGAVTTSLPFVWIARPAASPSPATTLPSATCRASSSSILLGWMLRRAFWGKGYATEGASAALQFAFTRLNQPRVISLIHPDNAASIRVAERLGERL